MITSNLFRIGALLSISLFAIHAIAQKQYVNKEWVKTTGIPDNLEWNASTFDALGNIIIAGNTLVAPGNPDVLVTKYNRDGELLWQHTYGGSALAQDYGTAVTADEFGNCFVAAAVSNDLSLFDIVLLKYGSSGNLIWSATWNGAANLTDVPSCIALDGNGNIYVGGSTYSSPNNPDYALVKFSATGVVLWSASYDYAGFPDVVTGISFDLAMDPVITGGSASTINEWDYATVRFNKITGAQSGVDRVTVPGVGLDNALAFTKDNAGNLFITGYREVNGERDIQTVRLNGAFAMDWVVNYDGEGHDDIGKALGADNQGRVYVVGSSQRNNGATDMLTIKYDELGNIVWEQRFKAKESTWSAEANKIVVTNDGGAVVSGTIFDGGSKNFITVKYSAEGKLEWTKEYDGLDGDDRAMGLLLGADGKVYVSGLSQISGTNVYAMVKYSPFKKEQDILFDAEGEPFCMANELLVKFRTSLLDTALVNDKSWEYGNLEKWIGADAAEAVSQKLGLPPGSKRIQAFKVFKNLRSTMRYSTSRLGEQVPLSNHWTTLLLAIPPTIDLGAARDSLSTLPTIVKHAEFNHVGKLASFPDDPLLNRQAGLLPGFGYANANINMEPAWAIQTGSPAIKVGVLDALIYYQHEDFGFGTSGGSKVIAGFDYHSSLGLTDAELPMNSHGTACAGIIGAITNNSRGVAGVAGGNVNDDGTTGVSLVSLAVSYSYNSFVIAGDLIQAMVDGSTETGSPGSFGCHILNNSYSYGSFNNEIYQAVRTCYRNQCVFVASRGNTQGPEPVYPACYGEDSWVLSVGASGTDGSYKSSFNGDFWTASSYGLGMDVIAPGTTEIVTTTIRPGYPYFGLQCDELTTGYQCFNGSSSAGPHVAGLAALLLSEHNVANNASNNLGPEDVEQLIERTATDIYGSYGNGNYNFAVGYDDHNGWGRINAGAAVQAVEQPFYRVVHSGAPISTSQTTFPYETIVIDDPTGDLENGTFSAHRVEVTHTYSDAFPLSAQILDVWDRFSATLGYSAATPVNGEWWGGFTHTTVGNTVSTIATTNCWFIEDGANGYWIPAPPEELRTAYSVYVYDPTSIGIDETDASWAFNAFPNPAGNYLTIQVDLPRSGNLDLAIFDVSGRTVMQVSLGQLQHLRKELDISNLARGVYQLVLQVDGKTMNRRFLKS